MRAKYKLGLVLSGGGAKGFAHLGVIKAIEEKGLKPDIISGVSSGALMGLLYADGKSVEEIMKFFEKASLFEAITTSFPRLGLMNPSKFKKQLRSFLSAKSFEELKTPFVVNATNITDGKMTIFRSGEFLVEAVIGSSSMPMLFAPQEIEGKQYLDGGVFCNMPVSPIRAECDYIIGVHVNPICEETKADSILEIGVRVLHYAIQSSTVSEKKLCDLVIDVKEVKKYGMFDLNKKQEIFDYGYTKAKEMLENFVME